MSSLNKFYFIVCLTILIVLTSASYWLGEKNYFLVPLILAPIYLAQFSFFLPIFFLLSTSENVLLKGVDLTSMKSIATKMSFCERFATFFCLTLGFLYGTVVWPVKIYACYAIVGMFFLFFYLRYRFYAEARKQNVSLKIDSIGQLIREINEQNALNRQIKKK